MKVAIITDTHCGAGNDNTVFNEYFIQFYEQLFFPYLQEHGIKTVLHLGDVFDRRKYINFNTLHTWHKRVFQPLHELVDRVDITVGNHDTYFKNTNQINSVQELLKSYPKFNVYTEPTEVLVDKLKVLYLPWICEETVEKSIKTIQDSDAKVCMGHLELIGFEMYVGHINTDKGLRSEMFDKFYMTLTGHFHQKSSRGGVHYLGAPYPMMWNDYNCQRGFHILDTETLELQFIPNPFQIYCKLSYNDSNASIDEILAKDYSHVAGKFVKVIVQTKNNPYGFDQYIENLQKYNPCDISIVDASFETGSLVEDVDADEAKDTLTILHEVVQSLETQHKNKLNNFLSELYVEALNTNDTVQGSG